MRHNIIRNLLGISLRDTPTLRVGKSPTIRFNSILTLNFIT